MTENKVRIEDHSGNVFYPHTKTDIVFTQSGESVESQLAQKPSMTTGNLTLYVSTTGNDNNDGLTAGTALRTVQAAINKIPQILRHPVVINIAAGTYAERPVLENKYGASIVLQGATTKGTTHQISGLDVRSVSSNISIRGFYINNATNHNITSNESVSVNIQNCLLAGSTTNFYGILFANSTGNVTGTEIKNKYAAIGAIQNAKVFSANNLGTGNLIGLNAASNAAIGKTGTQPSGTNASEFAELGGIIRQ